jgi:molybdopterin-guanine dinucleotide biosynthesis protein B
MRVFSVCGISGTGKTTTIEYMIRELVRRKYTVGSVKEIHFEAFAIDTPGTNTDRHRQAGSQLVTALGIRETDVLYPEKLPVEKVLAHYHHDFVVLEGVEDGNFPKIITARNREEIDRLLDEHVIAIAGRISSELKEYKGLPVLDGRHDTKELVDLIEAKVYPRLPDFPPECCSHCGSSCRELGIKILQGKAQATDCVLHHSKVQLLINEREITMVPFVQNILCNAVEAVVKELDGYQEGAPISIQIRK